MDGPLLLQLAGVFLGGALPWLEAVIVIPIGIVAGLPPVAVVLAGLAGNLLTVALAAFAWERVQAWWRRRRSGGSAPARDEAGGAAEPSGAVAMSHGRRGRSERIFRRWGLPGLALVGPIGIGTQLSAVVAVAFGVEARRAFAWVAAGTVAWCVAAAVLTLSGQSFLGVGA